MQLGLSIGLAAFLVGAVTTATLAMHVADWTGGGGFFSFVAAGLVNQLPVLALTPALTFAAGLFFQGPGKAVSASAVIGCQAFPVLALVTAAGTESIGWPAAILVFLSSAAGGLLNAAAWQKAQSVMEARLQAQREAEEKSRRLATIDFTAVAAQAAASEGEKAPEGAGVQSSSAPGEGTSGSSTSS